MKGKFDERMLEEQGIDTSEALDPYLLEVELVGVYEVFDGFKRVNSD